jgi:hypothetical protein
MQIDVFVGQWQTQITSPQAAIDALRSTIS